MRHSDSGATLVKGDILNHHADPDQADTFKRMEGLYSTVINSFAFVPAK